MNSDKSVSNIVRHKLWIPALASVILVMLIPLVLQVLTFPQTNTINGIAARAGGRIFFRALDAIKDNNGVLVIGTSETGNELDGVNYWGVLNKDSTVHENYTMLAGAGRSYTIYFPLILKNPDAFENLKVLVYINPTYWREGLCEFNNEYFTRYVGPSLALDVEQKAKERGIYEEFIEPAVYDSIPLDQMHLTFAERLSTRITDFRSFYSYDFQRLLNDKEKINHSRQNLLHPDEQQLLALKQGINSEFNVSEDYLLRSAQFPPLDKSCNHRYKGLYEFISLCKDYKIDATYYVGPYNALYCERKNPELIGEYEELLANIKAILKTANVPFIDGTEQSRIPGTFLDVQHISKYGALLTAQQIAQHYEASN